MLDTIRVQINAYDRVDKSARYGVDHEIRINYLDKLQRTDSSDLSKLLLSVKYICDDWMVDKNKLQTIDDLKIDKANKEKTISNLTNLVKPFVPQAVIDAQIVKDKN